MLEAMINDATLQEQGVNTVYVEEDFEDNAAGRFALRNMMNVNQFYSEAMAEDVKRGMMDNARKCMVNGRCPYGLRKGADGRYEINPEQAEIVREIFNRVKDGWNHIDIMDDLNARGIRNRDGNLWQRSTFDKLLRNEQYIGVYRFSGVRIDGGIPAILDRQLFEEVQFSVRKAAHFTEYMILGLLIRLCLESWFGKRKSLPVSSWAAGALYACTDELHQLLTDGRSGQWQDVLIDSSGVLAGVLISTLALKLVRRNARTEKGTDPCP
jgi:VanZ family protein